MFSIQRLHANRANSVAPKAFKHLSTNIKTRQLSQKIFRSVAGQTSVYFLAIMNIVLSTVVKLPNVKLCSLSNKNVNNVLCVYIKVRLSVT